MGKGGVRGEEMRGSSRGGACGCSQHNTRGQPPTSNAPSSLLLGMMTYMKADTATKANANDFQCLCTLSGNAVNTPLPPLMAEGVAFGL